MTDQEIQIAIAEACGWQLERKRHNDTPCFRYCRNGESAGGGGGFGGWGWFCSKEQAASRLPDYLNDLNAMHEAEAALNTDPLQHQYGVQLHRIVIQSGHNYAHPCYGAIRATARQRAEAFLRTIGKWKE